MSEQTEQKPVVQLTGNDGNAFAVMGACQRAARKAGWPDERWQEVQREMMSGSYDELLAVACREFDVR